jgi:hypothetical protein
MEIVKDITTIAALLAVIGLAVWVVWSDIQTKRANARLAVKPDLKAEA